ncbi:hypothetical protein KP509_19G063700 [Ceratopteris richardii]|nr:hypothetical protein KP509_19G063700 [Ceratopteris richardii]
MNSELPISLSSSVPERCKSTSVGRRPPIISTLLKPLGVKSPPPKMAKAQTRKPRPYLPPLSDKDKDKKTLVLDLDGTLINSSMKPSKCSFVVQINGFADIYVLTRPGVEEFIQNMSAKYELVIFTAGKKEYADPIINNIDKNRLIRHRLYRESCSCYEKRAVKDLRNLGRDLKNVILLDNTPHCYSLQPQNGLAISSFTDDEEDTELMDLTPFLLLVAELDDVRESLNSIPRKTAN